MDSYEFPTRFGKYILLDLLNSGGMAQIFLARVTGIESFQRLIAIKCIRPELACDERFASMFIDEANLAGQLMHPNIGQIYELGRYKDQLYIAMELVEGQDLRNLVRRAADRGVKVPIGFAAYVVSKAAEGLDYAHKKTSVTGSPLNLVHRDVSPQNILVTYDGAVKVVDFGIAKANQRTRETNPGVLKGKFSYMAPEQMRGKEIDHRADIFTLGSVLYELLTGNKLFDGATDLEVVEKVRTNRLPDMRAEIPDAPEELIEALRLTHERDIDKRFQWASELAKALEPLLIEDRAIFGAQNAAAFMRELFSEEVQTGARPTFGEVRADIDSDASKPNQEIFASHFNDSDDDEQWEVPTKSLHPGRPTIQRSGPHSVSEDEHDALDATEDSDDSDQWNVKTDDSLGSKSAKGRRRSSIAAEFDPPRRSGPLAILATVGLVIATIFLLTWGSQEPEPAEDSNRPQTSKSATKAEWGFVAVKVQGARTARVVIDGRDVGRAPLSAHRLKTGPHTIKILEQRRGRTVKTRIKKITVGPQSTRRSPEVVNFSM